MKSIWQTGRLTLLLVLLGLLQTSVFSQPPDNQQIVKSKYPQNLERKPFFLVKIEGLETLPNGRELISQLTQRKNIRINDSSQGNWDLRIKLNLYKTLFSIMRSGFWKVAEIRVNEPKLVETILERVEREAKSLAIRVLENQAPKSKVKIELRVVPLNVQLNQRREVIDSTPKNEPRIDQYKFLEGDFITFEFRNIGEKTAYVTLLDFTADGRIGVLFPLRGLKTTANETMIPPDGNWKRLPPPYTMKFQNLAIGILKC
jgi:hypothetical protein